MLRPKLKPKPLKPGDRVAIIAPSTPSDAVKVKRSEEGLKALGLVPVFYPSCFMHHGHLAGTDEMRLKDIHDAFAAPDIQGIICMKGGSGATRLLDKIDYEIIASNPKLFVGYSDITALHLAFQSQCGLVTVHGPMALSDMFKYENDSVTLDPYTSKWYKKNLFEGKPLEAVENPTDQPIKTLVGGVATGELVGGNLSLILSTLGSPYEIDTKDKILFIEEVHEAAYVVDRMLSALALAGKFRDAAGIILGTFTNCDPEKKESYSGCDLSLDVIFDEVVTPWNKPTILNLYGGHNTPQLSFPLGVRITLDADRGCVTFLESAFQEV